MAEHRATVLISTPTFCQAYLRTCEPAQFATIRHTLVGAERLPASLAAAFREKYGITLLEGYGCTEMGPVVAVNAVDVSHGAIRRPATSPAPSAIRFPASSPRWSTSRAARCCRPTARVCCW